MIVCGARWYSCGTICYIFLILAGTLETRLAITQCSCTGTLWNNFSFHHYASFYDLSSVIYNMTSILMTPLMEEHFVCFIYLFQAHSACRLSYMRIWWLISACAGTKGFLQGHHGSCCLLMLQLSNVTSQVKVS